MNDTYAAAVASGSQLLFHHESILRKLRMRMGGTKSIRTELATLSYEVETLRTKLKGFENRTNNSILHMMHMDRAETQDEYRQKVNIQAEIDSKSERLKLLQEELTKLERREDESFYLIDAVGYLNRLTSAREQFHKYDAMTDGAARKAGRRMAIEEIQQITREFVKKFVDDPKAEEEGLPTAIPVNHFPQCPECKSERFVIHNQMEACQDCGYGRRCPMAGALSSYDRMKRMRPSREFTYKRLTHFRNTLKQACGVSCKTVPDELKERIREECVKRRVPFKELRPSLTRHLLKKLNYATFYEETISITCEINPTHTPLYIPPEREEELCFIFKVIEEPFERVKHEGNEKRQNVVSYPYTAIKICEYKAYLAEQLGNVKEAIEWRSYMSHFDLLKGIERLIEHDKIWKLICRELSWHYFNTIGNVAMSHDFSKDVEMSD
jgi:hypothetical protein